MAPTSPTRSRGSPKVRVGHKWAQKRCKCLILYARQHHLSSGCIDQMRRQATVRTTTLLKALLGMQHLRVTGFAVEAGALVIEVCPAWRTPRCSGCQRRRSHYDTRPPRRWRHLDFRRGARLSPVWVAAGGLPHMWRGRGGGAVVRRHNRAVHDPLRGGGGLPGPAVRQDVRARAVRHRVGHGRADRRAGGAPASARRPAGGACWRSASMNCRIARGIST